MKCFRNEYGHRDMTPASIKMSEHITREPNVSGSSVLDMGYIVSERLANESYIQDLQDALKLDSLLV